MINIKRKVVQHGPSTLIFSLPSKWVKERNIKKGDELEINELADDILISATKKERVEKISLNVTQLGDMIPGAIYSMYKRGVDELRLSYDTPDAFALIRKSLGGESIGYEILETGNNYCVIKNVIEHTKEFDHILRQTFLLLLSMAEDGYEAIKQGNLSLIKKLVALEQVNNRFMTFCRRYLNTKGSTDFDRIGPMYYIIEQLEKIADEFKYLYDYLASSKEKIEINEILMESFNDTNKMLRNFYTLFYKFNLKGVADTKAQRKNIFDKLYDASSKIKKQQDVIMHTHVMAIASRIFSMVDPYLILAFRNYSSFE